MPFDASFDDIYKFGIKGAAEDAGAYAERVDEQIFTEGILERVFNQINKADVVVADMTGRNPNVFYEVGYAHALDKIVLLLTQNSADIPFDLKHHQHVIYEGRIEALREELVRRLKWAIGESRTKHSSSEEQFQVIANDIVLSNHPLGSDPPLVLRVIADGSPFEIKLVVRNISSEESDAVSHIYLFTNEHSAFDILRFGPGARHFYLAREKDHSANVADGLTRLYRLPYSIPALPSDVLEAITFGVSVRSTTLTDEGEEEVKLRLFTHRRSYVYRLKLSFEKKRSATT
jgi:nucleoside 2-deoxyribosyltransferase